MQDNQTSMPQSPTRGQRCCEYLGRFFFSVSAALFYFAASLIICGIAMGGMVLSFFAGSTSTLPPTSAFVAESVVPIILALLSFAGGAWLTKNGPEGYSRKVLCAAMLGSMILLSALLFLFLVVDPLPLLLFYLAAIVFIGILLRKIKPKGWASLLFLHLLVLPILLYMTILPFYH